MTKNQATHSTPTKKIYKIVEEAMCIGCGICQSIAGAETLRLETSRSGYQHPVVVGELSESAVEKILAVCPSKRLESLPQHLITPKTQHDSIWGPYLRIVHGWAKDPEERFEGSTGGVLTALAAYLLASGKVEFILHAKASTNEPIFGERHLSFTRTDVLKAAGSRYGPTAPLIDIGEVLERGQPFAFIGKPCDISALRNYARTDLRVNELVKYWLTLVCGGFMPPKGTADFLASYGIALSDVSALRYRGRGFPGPTHVETKDGRVIDATYYDFWGETYDQWTLPHRCKVCPDSIGEGADMVAADPWPGGGPDLSDTSDPGTNVIIARTEVGAALLQMAENDGALELSTEATTEDLNHYQPHQVARRYTVWARFQGLLAEGHSVPETLGLRIKELSEAMDADFIENQKEGTRRRVRAGKASEPRPSTQPNAIE